MPKEKPLPVPAFTTNPDDPRVKYGTDTVQVPPDDAYLILPSDYAFATFERTIRRQYKHRVCGKKTTINVALAETFARDHLFYGDTYCPNCKKHLPVSEFNWLDGKVVGS